MLPDSESAAPNRCCLRALWKTYCYLPVCLAPWSSFLGKWHKPLTTVQACSAIWEADVFLRRSNPAGYEMLTPDIRTALWSLTTHPFLPKGVSPRCGSPAQILHYSSSHAASFNTKRDLGQSVPDFFPFPPHPVRSTRAATGVVIASLSRILQVMVSVCFFPLLTLVLVSWRPLSADSLFFLKGSLFRAELYTGFHGLHDNLC